MAEYKNGQYVTDLSTFYPVRYGLYGAMTKSEGLMPSTESKYDGGDGDEDMTEYEGEDLEVGGVDSADLPRFRTLVKDKKLQLKAQYGKGYWVVTERWKTLGIWGPEVGSRVNIATATAHPRKTKWVPGWRKKWREFKQAGGLAQLKLQARGMATPTLPPVPPATRTPFLQNIRPASISKAPGNRSQTAGQQPQQNASMRMDTEKRDKFIAYAVIAVVAVIAIWFIMKTAVEKTA